MAVQVNPITQSLPATTAIQDPATRRFAQAVEDALRALRSEEGAVESLKKAADAMNNAVAGGTPASIAQWLFSSELYQKLTTEIARVDTQAKQDVLDEALARSQAIQEIQAALAEIESTPAYDSATTYQVGDLVTYDNKLYRAKAETTGNLPTNTTYWDKVGDYATIGDVVAAHTLQLSEIESDITDIGGDLAAEITARDTLATQLRGTYTGTDVAMVSQGLLYSERQARVTADGVTVSNLNALRAQVGVTEAGALTEGFILDEQTIRNTNDLAIVSAVNTALAQITGVSNSISQSGQNLIANWTTAQAEKWSQIEAEVLSAGGQTIRAALAEESDARATLEGQVSASWMVKAEVDVGTGKPYVAGIALGAEGQGGAATSEFLVRADRFAMVMPGYGEYIPFAIGDFGPEFSGLTSWSNVTGANKPQDGATVGAEFGKNITGQITPSNVTTYIANAAIGNAQIDNIIQSNNYVPDVSGWYINKSGFCEFQDGLFRGTIKGSIIDGATIISTNQLQPTDAGAPYYTSLFNQSASRTATFSREGYAGREHRATTAAIGFYAYNQGPANTSTYARYKKELITLELDISHSSAVVDNETEQLVVQLIRKDTGVAIRTLVSKRISTGTNTVVSGLTVSYGYGVPLRVTGSFTHTHNVAYDLGLYVYYNTGRNSGTDSGSGTASITGRTL